MGMGWKVQSEVLFISDLWEEEEGKVKFDSKGRRGFTKS